MLKHRVIPTLLWNGTFCIKPRSFEPPGRNVGSMMQYIKNMDSRDIDELIILDIEATRLGREPLYDNIKQYTSQLFCPLTVGGGICTLEHIEKLLKAGADKVCLGSSAINLDFVKEAANKFGSQCIVVSIDFKTTYKKDYTIRRSHSHHNYDIIYTPYINNGTKEIEEYKCIKEYAIKLVESGAGEIILTDINKDGTRTGYNKKAIELVSKAIDTPVIANGGCMGFHDMKEALDYGAHAVAASSMFLFTGITPKNCSYYLDNHGYSCRTEA